MSSSDIESWHPAFRPNSDKDVASSREPEHVPLPNLPTFNNVSDPNPHAKASLKNQSVESQDLLEGHAPAVEDVPAIQAQERDVDHGPEPVQEVSEPNIKGHQEIEQRFRETDIPEAISFADNDRELIEGAENADEVIQPRSGITAIPLEDDAPHTQPAENKQLSTMSFTRTAGAVDFGEEDEIDSEWNLNPPQLDPWKNMAQTSRTNSFPAVPPPHLIAPEQIQPLHANQAEDIMHEVEQETKDMFGDDDDVEDSFFAQSEDVAQPAEAYETTFEQDLSSDGQVYGGVKIDLEGDSEDRFEEGVPLFQAKEDHATVSAIENAFEDDEDDFFSKSAQNDQLPESHAPLERKSTSQVIESLHFQPQHAIEDVEEEKDLSSHPPNNDLVDEADKWKALLDDDGLLDDDDELLPDDDDVMHVNSQTQDIADLFGSDDEGFLEDDETPIVPTQISSNPDVKSTTGRPSSSDRYTPAGFHALQTQPSNPYAPSPGLQDVSKQTSFSPAAYGSPTIANFQPPQQPRPDVTKAQSFADKSKGGYASPYDLPMDVVKPRKRPAAALAKSTTTAPPAHAPPPRSSSINSNNSVQANTLSSPPTSGHSNKAFPPPQSLPQPERTVRKTQSGFFEDLPITAKPRQPLRHASSFVTQSSLQTPQAVQPPPRGASPYAPLQQASQVANAGLIAPERVSPYAALPGGTAAVPPVASRYSPAPPPSSQSAPIPPPSNARYSPAPPNQKQAPVAVPSYAPPPALPHMPRTSSPLAHFERSQDPRQTHDSTSYERRASSNYESTLRNSHLPPTDELEESNPRAQAPPQSLRQTPPPPRSSSRSSMSPPKRKTSSYLPQSSNGPHSFAPPQRSLTQSPGASFGPRIGMTPMENYDRSASMEPLSHSQIAQKPQSQVPVAQNRPRGFSTGLNYIAPTDGREKDPLQRWRGAPIFVWGVGGALVTSFPRDVPRYGAGQTTPMVIRSPGEVKIRNIKDVDPLPERLTSFPGPLKGKSKKKEVVSWLTAGINILESEASYLRSVSHLSHEDKRVEERILLWKILRVFIENDGILEGNPAVNKAIRDILAPDVGNALASAAPLYATGANLSGITASSTGSRPDPADAASVEELRKHLIQGEREKAVWEAVDKRLWAHALLISNTVSRELYKQVAQEFVQKEVKNIGANTESLAALYDIFSGNFEESIDELVPPSARAGFQMISTSKTPASKDALEGLDRWRETLGLVLSNRSPDDSLALNALGKLLSGYGRAEAAHICFLFARSHTVFGGIDDPATNVVLIGADHLRQPQDFDKEMEPILLSETFEYGMSLSSTSNTPSSHHLAVYKLQHAIILAEYGYREKAIQYCDSINAAITAQTRRSPYHHAVFVSALDDLYKRLKQSPRDGTSSWISKPSIDKVGGSLLATFNKFVAGDADETASNGSAGGNGAEIGPFSMIAGGTPTVSRSPSKSDLFGSYGAQPNGIPIPHSAASSRYAPGGQYAPNLEHQGSYSSQPRNSYEGRSSGEYRRQQNDYRPTSQHSNSYSLQSPASVYAPQSGYSPYSPQEGFNNVSSQPELSTPITEQPRLTEFGSPQHMQSFDAPRSLSSSEPASRQVSNGYIPQGYSPVAESRYQAPEDSIYQSQNQEQDQSSATGYEAPSSGYEPPAYQPYEPAAMNDEPESPVEKPKKKSFMDDDDDDDIPALKALKKSSATTEKSKAEKDREAEEAFRKAAEADAARDTTASAPAQKKGWGLTGWFGGKKETSPSPEPHAPNKPIRAKLGEQSSFVYDENLKRWVNKKAGVEDTAAKTATPPPPKSNGPPRSASSGPPTSAPRPISSSSMTGPPPIGQRVVSESSPLNPSPLAQFEAPSMSRTASNSSTAPPGGPNSRPGSVGPPLSRPGTGMSNASSIDDLLGPASIKGGKKGAGSAPGTTRGRKKGRGYVDLMAGGAPTPVGGDK